MIIEFSLNTSVYAIDGFLIAFSDACKHCEISLFSEPLDQIHIQQFCGILSISLLLYNRKLLIDSFKFNFQ